MPGYVPSVEHLPPYLPEQRAELRRLDTDLQEGRHVVVVVVCGADPSERNWIITAYIARILAKGDVEWTRN